MGKTEPCHRIRQSGRQCRLTGGVPAQAMRSSIDPVIGPHAAVLASRTAFSSEARRCRGVAAPAPEIDCHCALDVLRGQRRPEEEGDEAHQRSAICETLGAGVIEQRAAQHQERHAEVDDEPGDVHERGDERRRRARRIEAEPLAAGTAASSRRASRTSRRRRAPAPTVSATSSQCAP